MPELPEIETIKTQLAEKIIGRKIVNVQVRLLKLFWGDKKSIIGTRIVGVGRRAKMLNIRLSDGRYLVVHLKMTGQMVYGEVKNQKSKIKNIRQNPKVDKEYIAETVSFHQGIPLAGFELPGKSTHVIFDLDHSASSGQVGKLFFNDNRRFGWIRVMTHEQLRMYNEKLGPEPFAKEFSPEYLLRICNSWGRPIKLLLMEQSKIAGIGNIYANEALWCARISPLKSAKDLAKEGPERIKKLYRCILEVLTMGIKHQGSSVKDKTYVNALGEKGKMQEYFAVYQKVGSPCPRCGRKIKMTRVGGRGTFYCPNCQKG